MSCRNWKVVRPEHSEGHPEVINEIRRKKFRMLTNGDAEDLCKTLNEMNDLISMMIEESK